MEGREGREGEGERERESQRESESQGDRQAININTDVLNVHVPLRYT